MQSRNLEPCVLKKARAMENGHCHSKGSWLLVTYFIPGCVGRGVRLGSENSSGAGGMGPSPGAGPSLGPSPGPSLGPSRVQARAQAWAQAGPELGAQKIQKIRILKIKIRSAQNVGKVWISRKKNLPAPFGAIPGHFLLGPEKSKKCIFLPIFLGGPLLLSTLGGAIGSCCIFIL